MFQNDVEMDIQDMSPRKRVKARQRSMVGQVNAGDADVKCTLYVVLKLSIICWHVCFNNIQINA